MILVGGVLAHSACRDDKPAIAQRGTGDAFVADLPNRERERRALISATTTFTRVALPVVYDVVTMHDTGFLPKGHFGAIAGPDQPCPVTATASRSIWFA